MPRPEPKFPTDPAGTAVAPLPAWPRPVRALPAIAAGLLWTVVILSCWYALRDPLEVEVREGTVWLHVLAQQAGVSIYDHTRVAFLNMNHGPLDPVFKGWIHRALPLLPAQAVTRAFVALLPLAMLALFASGRRGITTPLLWAGGLMVFLYGLGSMQFLIGRSDPTALALLGALLVAAAQVNRNRPRSALGRIVSVATLGALAAVTALVNTRYALAGAVVLTGFGVESIVDASGPRWRAACAYVVTLVGAAAATIGLVIQWQFHGDFELYWRHCFGVFTRGSGWGAAGRMPYEFFPAELRDGRHLVHAGIAMCLVLALRMGRGSSHRRSKLIVWTLALAGGWVGFTWAFAYNHGGAGLQYFAPLYLIIAFLGATRIPWALVPRVQRAVVAGTLLLGLPWIDCVNQVLALRSTVARAEAFKQEINTLAGDAPIYSEDVHLYQRAYAGETIDVGDMVTLVARRHFFGPEFTAVVDRQERALREHPPRFVLVGASAVISENLRDLLAARYDVAATSGPLLIGNGTGPLTLYRLRIPFENRSDPRAAGAVE